MLERVIYNRLLPVIASQKGISDRQYVLRKARLIINAIKLVTGLAGDAIHGKDSSSKYSMVVNLLWKCLAKTSIPEYLAVVTDSYLQERTLWYDTGNGPQEYAASEGASQGSVLGQQLWNIMCNEVLNFPAKVKEVGYVDDIALVVVIKLRC